jgi:hypothetical protein
MSQHQYPTVQFMKSSGDIVAVVVALLVLAGGCWLAAAGFGWGWAAAGAVAGVLLYGFIRLLVELVRIIADTLLPQ